MIKKKNSFWTFCFSFLPGAAEMYMGFMKMGVSLMATFFAIIAIGSFVELGPLLFISAVVWFYGFFHARNLAALDQMQLQQIQDCYLFIGNDIDAKAAGKKYRNLIAGILIFLGLATLWTNIFNMIRDMIPDQYYDFVNMIGYNVPKIVVAVFVILIGMKMISGKKEELEHDESVNGTESQI